MKNKKKNMALFAIVGLAPLKTNNHYEEEKHSFFCDVENIERTNIERYENKTRHKLQKPALS